jgi:hypothetical protein
MLGNRFSDLVARAAENEMLSVCHGQNSLQAPSRQKHNECMYAMDKFALGAGTPEAQ